MSVCNVCWKEDCKSVCEEDFGTAKARIASLESALKEAEKALDKYGRHFGECESRQLKDHPSTRCTCGLSAALRGEIKKG